MTTAQVMPEPLVRETVSDIPDERLRDPEWIATEFAAIMAASGMSPRLVVAVHPGHRSPLRERPRTRGSRIDPRVHLFAARTAARVRSPPRAARE